MAAFRLKIWQIEQTCVFELSWGQGQQLMAKVPHLPTLTTLYQTWQQGYLKFYQSAMRARVGKSGTLATPTIDWRARLVEAEAKLLTELHYWLSHANLLEIRREIARAALDESQPGSVDVFLTCDSLDLERLPWEAWEIGTEFSAKKAIRIARTPANIRAERTQHKRRGKMRILAILGDDTGLNFQADREAMKSLSHLAEIHFVGWQNDRPADDLKTVISQAIADEQGWDILFFAGHSNETALTGGELTIAPNESIFLSEIAAQLVVAKERGLQFAIFNSCQGLSIAQTLINLGFSQVAVMREPIHNLVAQEFLVRFVQSLAQFHDVHDALLFACQSFKLDKNLTYPSASLVPSLFRHPDSPPFCLEPFGWKQRLRQWLPTPWEAIALGLLIGGSFLPPGQHWLMENRVLAQAMYRRWTGQSGPAMNPPILLIQIDDRSIQKAGISDPKPMSRSYLAQLVNQLAALEAGVIGIDFHLDRSHPEDGEFRQALESAIQRNGNWIVTVIHQSETGDWIMPASTAVAPSWSLSGDSWVPFWHIKPLPWLDSTPLPFSYLLAAVQRLNTESFQPTPSLPQPQLHNSQNLSSQVRTFARQSRSLTGQPLMTQRMQLQSVTAFSYGFRQRWLQPILDFSIPPSQVYETIPAWQFLEHPDWALRSSQLTSLRSRVVILMAGGYGEAGLAAEGEDNFPLPAAVAYWQGLQTPPDESRSLSGGKAHAYMTHHFLNHHLVLPIPDLWLLLLAIPVGKGLALLQKKQWQWWWIVMGTTAGYGIISLQLYVSMAVLLPWLLPSAVIWMYFFVHLKRKHNA